MVLLTLTLLLVLIDAQTCTNVHADSNAYADFDSVIDSGLIEFDVTPDTYGGADCP
jgi:hypothetical protein